ncbi:DUF4339 domain-containing protein [Lacipirellula sp.]|uniref:DUF4339 domain-containing protein n=1 Tax=Lacipirellula sp. TaxID=2691419 RepID=UPI003D0A21BC
MHEVSNDKVVWRQAADFPELFSTPEVRRPNQSSSTAPAAGAPAVSDNDGDIPLQDERDWYYAKNNVQNGPVTFEHLKTLTQAGALLGEDLVWKTGMAEWKPAWQIQGLQTVPLMSSTPKTGHQSDNKLATELVRTLSDSKAWSKFVAFCINTLGALSIALGLATFLFGVRQGRVEGTAGGLFITLWGSLYLTTGILLTKYNSNIERFVTLQTSECLDAAHRNLKSLWIFLSIVFLFFLLNTLVAAIWAFSIGLVAMD